MHSAISLTGGASPLPAVSAENARSECGLAAGISKNTWTCATADQLGILIDAEACFDKLDRSFRLARRIIYINGWDLDAGVRLRPGHSDQYLGDFIIELVEKK